MMKWCRVTIVFLALVLASPLSAGRSFNGSTDKIDFSSISTSVPTAYSIGCWINPSSVAAGARHFISFGDSADNWQVLFRQEGTKLISYHSTAAGASSFVSASEVSALSANTLFRVAITWDGSTGRLFRDGAEKATFSTTSTGAAFDDRNGFGYNRAGNNEFYNGVLADCFVIHNVALSLGELETVFWRGRSSDSFTRYYPLWGVSSPEVDLSGNADNGVLTGTAVADHAPTGPMFGFDHGWQGNFTPAVPPAGKRRIIIISEMLEYAPAWIGLGVGNQSAQQVEAN